ncbi:MAG: PilZ domain-containing protein [Gammaproteobacteria bacterium]|nr:MAG: PilZ domain-containing protein [Gammaproteobacteria bacterium]
MIMPEDDIQDKRHFTRILFDAPVTVSNDEHRWVTFIIDLSLKGALLIVPEQWQGKVGDHMTLDIVLNSDGTEIQMQTSVAHVEGKHFGLKCDYIDIDSITHLRRLIELNMGDITLLNRELGELTTPH